MFADDLGLLADCLAKLQMSLHRCSDWVELWSMKFDIKKCIITTFLGDMTFQQVNLHVGGEIVSIGDNFRCFGIQIDSQLSVNIIANCAKRRNIASSPTYHY
mgnify:CR=1 FL=1